MTGSGDARNRPALPLDTSFEVDVSAFAAGGEAIARLPTGKVVFVSGALPKEQVTVQVTSGRKDFARARVINVETPSAFRRMAPCHNVALGCGGCQWQHIDPNAQPRFKAEIVRDTLRRVGGLRLPAEVVRIGPALPSTGYRTTVRAAIDQRGRAGYRQAHSHNVVVSGACLVAHPVVSEVLATGQFGGSTEVLVRYATATDQLAVLTTPSTANLRLPAHLDARRTPDGRVTEVVRGCELQVSSASFFQARPDGAEMLVSAVEDALEPDPTASARPRRLIDLYGGVGLFACTLAGSGQWTQVFTVERNPRASHDAEFNLRSAARKAVCADAGAVFPHAEAVFPHTEALCADAEKWRAPEFSGPTHVVADPSRRGLGAPGVAAVAATGAERLALVSCDAAAFARDAALLAVAGFELVHSTLIDLFPNTFHVEIVSRFDRSLPRRAG